MQDFTTDEDFSFSIKSLYGTLKIVSAKNRWCLAFDAVYIMIFQVSSQLYGHPTNCIANTSTTSTKPETVNVIIESSSFLD